jgi:hypothetical protein
MLSDRLQLVQVIYYTYAHDTNQHASKQPNPRLQSRREE